MLKIGRRLSSGQIVILAKFPSGQMGWVHIDTHRTYQMRFSDSAQILVAINMNKVLKGLRQHGSLVIVNDAGAVAREFSSRRHGRPNPCGSPRLRSGTARRNPHVLGSVPGTFLVRPSVVEKDGREESVRRPYEGERAQFHSVYRVNEEGLEMFVRDFRSRTAAIKYARQRNTHRRTPRGSPATRRGSMLLRGERMNPSPRRFPSGTGAHFAGFEGV